MEASEVFRYLLLRDELQCSVDAGVEDEVPEFVGRLGRRVVARRRP